MPCLGVTREQISSVESDLVFHQHNKGNIEAVRQGWQMQIGGTIGGATLCKDIPIQASIQNLWFLTRPQ